MATTYYLPSSSGWGEDHGYAYNVRLKIEQTYNVSTNKSTLVITPQFKGGANGVTHGIVSGTTLKVGTTTLLDLGSPYGFYVTGGSWVDLKNLSTSETKQATYTVTHNADGSASLSFTFRGQTSSTAATCSFFNTSAATLNLQESRTFTLTINAGTGSSITVKRNGTSLSNGSTITYGDVLTITYAASTGYNLTAHTVNGTSFTSGNTHTVTGDVTVAATAAKKTFALTISAGTGSSITVKKNGTKLSNGATLTYGDVLTITFAASTGYNLSTHKVNNTTFTSGNTHTVTAAVSVTSTATKKTYTLSISAGTGSTATVKKGSTTLSNGATITHGDSLTVTFAASSGYSLATHTVNGATFTSGGTHTVSGNVAVVSSATALTPTVGTPTATPVDLNGNTPTYFSGVYIAGYRKVKVAAAVTAPSGISISSVKLSYPGGTTISMTYNSTSQKYEAVTTNAIAEATTYTVKATASNGKTASKTVAVSSVVPYTTPSITVNDASTYRCDSSGGTDPSSATYFQYYKIKAKCTFYNSGDLSGNSLTTFSVNIKGSSTVRDLRSYNNVQVGPYSMPNVNSRYTLVLKAQDKVSGLITREYYLDGILRNVVLKRSDDGTYVGIGKAPERTSGPSDIELPVGSSILIGADEALVGKKVSIPSSSSGTIDVGGNSTRGVLFVSSRRGAATMGAWLWSFQSSGNFTSTPILAATNITLSGSNGVITVANGDTGYFAYAMAISF